MTTIVIDNGEWVITELNEDDVEAYIESLVDCE